MARQQTTLEAACVRLVEARKAKAAALAARKAFDYTCEREKQVDPEDETRKQDKACWTGQWIEAQRGDYGRIELRGYWEYAGGNADEDDGDHVALWCKACQKRQVAYLAYRKAVREHAAASRVFWTVAHGVARRSAMPRSFSGMGW